MNSFWFTRGSCVHNSKLNLVYCRRIGWLQRCVHVSVYMLISNVKLCKTMDHVAQSQQGSNWQHSRYYEVRTVHTVDIFQPLSAYSCMHCQVYLRNVISWQVMFICGRQCWMVETCVCRKLHARNMWKHHQLSNKSAHKPPLESKLLLSASLTYTGFLMALTKWWVRMAKVCFQVHHTKYVYFAYFSESLILIITNLWPPVSVQ